MRPLPSGRLSAGQALWFGIALALIGGLELGFRRELACVGPVHFNPADVPVPVHAAEAKDLVVDNCRRISWRHASADRVCGCGGQANSGSLGFVRHFVYLAVPAFLCDRLDVSR